MGREGSELIAFYNCAYPVRKETHTFPVELLIFWDSFVLGVLSATFLWLPITCWGLHCLFIRLYIPLYNVVYASSGLKIKQIDKYTNSMKKSPSW